MTCSDKGLLTLFVFGVPASWTLAGAARPSRLKGVSQQHPLFYSPTVSFLRVVSEAASTSLIKNSSSEIRSINQYKPNKCRKRKLCIPFNFKVNDCLRSYFYFSLIFVCAVYLFKNVLLLHLSVVCANVSESYFQGLCVVFINKYNPTSTCVSLWNRSSFWILSILQMFYSVKSLNPPCLNLESAAGGTQNVDWLVFMRVCF